MFNLISHQLGDVYSILRRGSLGLVQVVPPCQRNDPPSQINVPRCQIDVPLSNKFPNFFRHNQDPRDIYLQEGHIFVSLFDHAYGP